MQFIILDKEAIYSKVILIPVLIIKFVCPLEKNAIFYSGPLSVMLLNAGVMLKEYFQYVFS